MTELLYLSIFMSTAAVFVSQFLLCRRWTGWVRFLPLLFCAVFTAGCFGVGALTEDGWTGAGLWLIGVFSLLPILACGLGWLAAVLLNRRKKP